MPSALELFSAPAREWFSDSFATPTEVQERGWRAVASGRHTLMTAPTGSGKTLAAFFWCLDRLAGEPPPPASERCRVLYISPLKALAVDVERNLRAPLAGITFPRLPTVALRSGDTSQRERAAIRRDPPDIPALKAERRVTDGVCVLHAKSYLSRGRRGCGGGQSG